MNTCITTYCYGGMPGAVLNSYIGLANYISVNRKKVCMHTIREDALISRSRCRSTTRFLNTPCDVWVQLDHDIEFEPEDLFRLAEIALEKNAAVCVPYPCRALPPRCALRPNGDGVIEFVGMDEVQSIQFCASGFMAVPRKVIEETISLCKTDAVPPEFRVYDCVDSGLSDVPQFPSLWHPMVIEVKPGEREYLSEDYSGCARMVIAGFEQYAWKKPVLKHWGEMPFKMPTKDEIKPAPSLIITSN